MRERFYKKTTRRLGANEFAEKESFIDRFRRNKRSEAKGKLGLPVSSVRLLIYNPYEYDKCFFLLGEDYKWYEIVMGENDNIENIRNNGYEHPDRIVELPRYLIDITRFVDIDQDMNEFFGNGDYRGLIYSYRKNGYGFPVKESVDDEYEDDDTNDGFMTLVDDGYEDFEDDGFMTLRDDSYIDRPIDSPVTEMDDDDIHGCVAALQIYNAINHISNRYGGEICELSEYPSESCIFVNNICGEDDLFDTLDEIRMDAGLPKNCLEIQNVGKNRYNVTFFIPKVFDVVNDPKFMWVMDDDRYMADDMKQLWIEIAEDREGAVEKVLDLSYGY